MNTEGHPIRLGSESHKQFVASLILKTPSGHFVTISAPKRSLAQNAAIHVALSDIADQLHWPPPPSNHGQKFPLLTWKRLSMAAFLREEGERPDLIPALDGKGFDIVYEKTSQLTVEQASKYLEWIYAFGAENGVVWSNVVPMKVAAE